MKNTTMKSGLLALIMVVVVSGCTQATKPDGETGAEGGGGVTDGGATVGTIGDGGAFAGTALEGMKVSYEKNAINDQKRDTDKGKEEDPHEPSRPEEKSILLFPVEWRFITMNKLVYKE